jgi:hypothetical protein
VHVAGEDAGRYTYFKIGDKFRKYFWCFKIDRVFIVLQIIY